MRQAMGQHGRARVTHHGNHLYAESRLAADPGANPNLWLLH